MRKVDTVIQIIKWYDEGSDLYSYSLYLIEDNKAVSVDAGNIKKMLHKAFEIFNGKLK